MAETPTSKRIYIFDSPRTRSQMFFRLFVDYPGISAVNSALASPFGYGPERIGRFLKHSDAAEKVQLQWLSGTPARNMATYKSTAEGMLERARECEKNGNMFLGKDHAVTVLKQDFVIDAFRNGYTGLPPGNPTYIPDELLATLQPVLLFRHPAAIAPSWWRTQSSYKLECYDEDFGIIGSLLYTRLMHEYLVSIGKRPLVVDTDDLVRDPEGMMGKVCAELGIDAAGVRLAWDEVPEEHWPHENKQVQEFAGDLLNSKGVQRAEGEASDTVDLDAKVKAWAEKFGKDPGGNDVATALREFVQLEIPSYEYLRQYRLRV